MASRRRSFRKKKSGGGMKWLVLAVIVGAGGFGAWYFLGEDSGPSDDGETTVAGVTLVTETEGSQSSDNSQRAKSLAQVESMLADVQAEISTLDGEARAQSLRDGYKRIGSLLTGALPVAERERAIEVFHQITDELFFSSTPNEFSKTYEVKSGDSWARIASRHRISMNLLWDMNNTPRGTTRLNIGVVLKVPVGEPKIVVRKSDYTTSVYLGKYLVRQYVVAHGRNNITPEGTTRIKNMAVDPEKSSRGANDQVNEMKLRWIGLVDFTGKRAGVKRTGIGFHGTQHPDSIPGMTSRGCIRMSDRDVVELYDIVREGNKVEIKA